MKVGDLVKFRNLDPSWGEHALITQISDHEEWVQPSMITLLTSTGVYGTIPWCRRNTYIKEVVNNETR